MPMESFSVRANVRHSTSDWNAIDWKQAHRIVRNLRQRIFKAAAAGDLKRVGSLHYYCHMQKTAWDRRARLLPGRSGGPKDTLLEPDAW